MGVNVDASDAIKRLEQIENAVNKKGMQKLARKSERLMLDSVNEAFAGAKDPETGRPWAPRKQPAGHRPLYRRGDLYGMIKCEAKVWIGQRASRLYLKFGIPDRASALIKAGSIFHGRKQARSSKGTRLKGYMPRGGYMVGRRYMGMSRSARKQLASEAKRLTKRRS